MDPMEGFIAALIEDEQNQYRQLTGRLDWHYRNVPWISSELFEEMVEVIGSENILWISSTTIQRGGQTYHRGYAMFSPAGVANVEQWMLTNR